MVKATIIWKPIRVRTARGESDTEQKPRLRWTARVGTSPRRPDATKYMAVAEQPSRSDTVARAPAEPAPERFSSCLRYSGNVPDWNWESTGYFSRAWTAP